MRMYQGYETKKEVKEAQKKLGGWIVEERFNKRTGKPTPIGQVYEDCIYLSGADRNKAKYFLIYMI